MKDTLSTCNCENNTRCFCFHMQLYITLVNIYRS